MPSNGWASESVGLPLGRERPCSGKGLGDDVLGVLTGQGAGPNLARGLRELQEWPGMADLSHLGVVDLDNAPIGEERLVGQCLARRSYGCHAHPG